MIDMTWQQYVNWLIKNQNLNVHKALDKAGEVYERQHKKPFKTEKANEIVKFWDDFWENDKQE